MSHGTDPTTGEATEPQADRSRPVPAQGVQGPAPQAAPGPRPSNETLGYRLVAYVMRAWSWLFLVVVTIGFAIAARDHVSVATLEVVLLAAAIPLVVALGQTIVVISAGIDLSVAFTVGLGAVIAALVVRAAASAGWPLAAAIVVASIAGVSGAAAVGTLNGVIIGLLHVPPFITTLGTYGIAQGIAFLLTGGPSIGHLPDPVATIGNSYVVNVHPDGLSLFSLPSGVSGAEASRYLPNMVALAAVLTAVMAFILTSTRFGQHVYAIGSNQQAAMRAGIPVVRRLIGIYALAGALAGCAGLISVFRFQAGDAAAGEQVLLQSIAIVVIGGASLFGGRGTIVGTVIGALIIAVLQTGLILVGAPPFWQFIAVGIVIIIAVSVDQARSQILGRMLRTA